MDITSVQNTIITSSCTIAASGHNSTIFPCGGVQLAKIILPSNWTTSDITFNDGIVAGSTPYAIYVTDLSGSQALFTINSAVANASITVPPFVFNRNQFMQLSSTVAQSTAVTVILVFAPFFQGIHG